jgi:transposase InsO family protein
VRSAEQPGQALNVDLCFVPEQHAAQEKLPAVSGSSGHLVVERIRPDGEAPHWPGQVFAQPELEYEAAMRRYVEATRDRLVHAKADRAVAPQASSLWRQANEAQAERYRVRAQRKREDADWRAAKAEHRQAVLAHQALSRQERKRQPTWWEAKEQAWQKLRGQRLQILRQRPPEDEAWHQRNQALKAGLPGEAETRAWIAILVVTDNCTRQCLGLPIFRTGARLTSQEVVAALQAVLPAELAFLISDQGTHFRSTAFAQLAQEAGFIHVPVYRHRPESNGIAERFVLTLKDGLRSQAWQSAEELESLLALFLPEYNDRPHQGLAMPGLSPNEFANRIWLM